MTNPTIEKLIRRQIHQWNRYRELLETASRPEEIRPRPIVTISRQKGSGARELATALARRLDLEIHGASLIDHIARDARLEREVVANLDERARSQVDLWVKGVLNRRIFLRDNYHVALARAVRTLAAHGGVVIIGRGANFILADACSLRVLLVAPAEERAARIAAQENLSTGEAGRRLAELDEERRLFIRKMFGVEADDPEHYDLTLNTARLPRERTVEVVMSALESRGVFAAAAGATA
jgi:cytidylate kinase